MKHILIPRVEVFTDRYFRANKEIYKRTEIQISEKFGKESRAYEIIMKGISHERALGSKFFFNIEVNSCLPPNQRTILLEDIERIYLQPFDFFDDSFYADTSELILRNEIPLLKNNKHILVDLIKQVKAEKYEFSSENPLRISGLELIKDDDKNNYYGLLLKIGDETKFTNDKRFAYFKKEIVLKPEIKLLYTRENGLTGIRLNKDNFLDSCNPYLDNSNNKGRIIIKSKEY